MAGECAPQGHHVFTVVSGFGLRVIPRAPFEAVHGPGPRELDVTHGSRFARVIADGRGGYRSKLDELTSSLFDVVDVERGPDLPAWHLETRDLLAPLPEGFHLHSVPASSASPFDLVGPGDALIYVQTPARVPAIGEMCGPGQEVSASGATWVEVRYAHEGRGWWQRHVVVGARVFTVQAAWDERDAARRALDGLLGGLRSPSQGVAQDRAP